MGTTKRERQKANRQQRLEELARTARRNKTRRLGTRIAIIVGGFLVLVFGISRLIGNDDDEAATATTVVPLTVASATSLVDATTTTSDPNATTTTEGPTTTVAVPFVYGTAPCPAEDGSTPTPDTFAGPPQKCIDDTKGYLAEVVTNKGSLTITLDARKSPGNVNNFVTLARYGYYDGNGCHRVIKDFVVQCGRKGDDESAPGYTVNDEVPGPDQYAEGVVAVANTGSANSGGGQWFIVTGPNGASLPPSYSIIGYVSKGYDSTVKVLENLADPFADNGVPPLVPIEITSVTIKVLDAPPVTTTTSTTAAPVTDPTAVTDTAGTGTDTTDTVDVPAAPDAVTTTS